jgi:hypothetical protein
VDPPPPPPREGGTTTCPRPPSFWSRQCRGHRHGTSLSPSALASIAASVDARSAVFNWQNPSRGFAATLNPGDDGLRERTLRQYAAVLANLCAHDAGLAVGGSFIGVGGDATFQAGAGQLAVEDWVAAAEVQLLSLRGQRGRERSARTVMRRLFSDAWAINHGVGMATTCAPPRERDADDQSAGAAMGDGDIGLNLASPPAGAGVRASLTSPRLMKYQ